MDFWTRLFGVSYAPRKPVVKAPDPQSRFTRFRTALADVERTCSHQRDLAREEHTLGELQKLFEKLAQIIREETRAPIPHPCVQFAASQNIFVAVNRAAAVSFHEGCIYAAIALMAALVDSEEESFLTSTPFARSLMRLVIRVVAVDDVELSVETETFILELLFTISAKIRLQPDILPSWFSPSRRLDSGDEKVQHAQISKDDFPLCYILVERIYHDGRIGDFARTGLLYIFEATGKSIALQQWIIETSDVCTLMASGLGALYSQLSRELSILYPDAVLPAALALSDYTTTHSQTTAESAFSERHVAHMTTFLSYLAFWQDILDHCKSEDVKQALLDHFQVLFLQQLLYPSILQSSDTDGGSSVAILSYLNAILESLEHTTLTNNIMSYLMGSDETSANLTDSIVSLQRRQGLVQMTASMDLDIMAEPALFSLTDLLQNSLASSNAQTLFSALRLTTTIITRQSSYALQTMFKPFPSAGVPKRRLIGAVHAELEQYTALASRIHDFGIEAALRSLTSDAKLSINATASDERLAKAPHFVSTSRGSYTGRLLDLLRTFFTNSIDVNLALTEALVAIASCPELSLEGWLALDDPKPRSVSKSSRSWQRHLDQEEEHAFALMCQANTLPEWPLRGQPRLFALLTELVSELDTIRQDTPGLDNLITARKNLLQAASVDTVIDLPPSMPNSPGPGRQEFLSPTSPSAPPSTVNGDGTLLSPAQIFQPPPAEAPATTDVLMQNITFSTTPDGRRHTASLNHVLTNTIVLQEFILEIVAIIGVRATVYHDARTSVD